MNINYIKKSYIYNSIEMTKSPQNKKQYNEKTNYQLFNEYGFQGVGQREKCIAYAKQHNYEFFFTNNKNNTFCIKDINDFHIDENNTLDLYEMIKFKGYKDNGVPLYFDIEYYSSKADGRPLGDFIDLLNKYTLAKYKHIFDKLTINHYYITKATRELTSNGGDKTYYKNSFHIIVRPTREVLFENTGLIKMFILNFYNWCNDSVDLDIIEKRKNLYCLNPAKSNEEQKIIDLQPYAMTEGKSALMRTIYSCKDGDINSRLEPFGYVCQLKATYLIQYTDRNQDTIYLTKDNIPTPNYMKDTIKKQEQTKLVLKKVITEKINPYTEKRATLLIKQHHPNAILKEKKILPTGDFQFNFDDKCGKCLIHNCIHPNYEANYPVYYNTEKKSYTYWCFNCEDPKYIDMPKFCIPLKKLKGFIDTWDYIYDDRVDINCLPLPSPEEVGEGGTFLLQAPKGSGKSEAMIKMLNDLPKDKSVLILTYRRSLCIKYLEEVKGLYFENYENLTKYNKNQELDETHFHRLVCCLDSISKTTRYEIKKTKYDIIIIDEVYSVLEHFASPLMDISRVHIQNNFEFQMKNASVVYCLDAHLDNKLCIGVLHELREVDKFIYHNNPNTHNFTDYNVFYDEVSKTTDLELEEEKVVGQTKKGKDKIKIEKHKITRYDTFNQKIIEELSNNKKIAIVSSAKSYSIEIADIIKDAMENEKIKKGKILLYNSETDKDKLKEEISKPDIYWGSGNTRVVIYTPTISAGISYNCIDEEKGFHKVFAYLKTGRGVASFNTHNQMLFRLRRLIDKEYHILFDRKHSSSYDIEESDIETMLYNDTERLFETIGKSFNVNHLNQGIDMEKDFRPKYDYKNWTYILWKEISKHKVKYSKPYNFKEGLKEVFSNKSFDAIPGRNMNWIDLTQNQQEVELEEVKSIKIMSEQMKNVIETKQEMRIKEKLSLPLLNDLDYEKIKSQLRNGENVKKTDIERYKLRVIERTYKIDLNIIREANERLHNIEGLTQEQITDNNEEWSVWYELWKKIIKFDSKLTYKNQRMWKLKFKSIEDLQKYSNLKLELYSNGINGTGDVKQNGNNKFTEGDWKYFINSEEYEKDYGKRFSKLQNSQIIAQLNTFGLQKMNRLVEVCKWLDIPVFEELHGVEISREKLKELADNKDELCKMVKNICVDFKGIIKEPVDKYEFIRNQLSKFQHENPNTWLYDYDRDKLLKDYNLEKYKSVEHLKESDWKNKAKKKLPEGKEGHIKLLETGCWTCAAYTACDPMQWSEKQVKTMIEKVFQQTLAYSFENNRKIGDKWSKVKFLDIFENLIEEKNTYGEDGSSIHGLNALRREELEKYNTGYMFVDSEDEEE